MDYLDFIILKINGMDVSKSPHADAVREFMAADEPIVVEVVRRISKTSPNTTSCSSASSISTDLKEASSDLEMLTSFNQKNDIGVVYSNAKDLDVDATHSNDQSKQLQEDDEEDDEDDDEDNDDEEEEDADGDRDDNEIIYENGCIFRKYVQCDCRSCNENDGEIDVGSKLISRSVQTNITAVNWVDELDEYLLHVNLEDMLAQKSTSSNSSTSESTRNGNGGGVGSSSQTEEHFHEATYSSSSHQDIETGKKKSSHTVDYINDQASNEMLTKSPTNSFIRTQLDNINEQIALLDHRMNRIKLINHNRSRKDVARKPCSDVEHIYETIQDSETEPIYSSPYEPDVGSNSYGNKSVGEASKMPGDADAGHQPSFTFKLDCKPQTNRSILKLCTISDDWNQVPERTHRSGDKGYTSSHPISKTQPNTSSVVTALPCKNRRRYPIQIPADTMYTNIANLHQTIMLQQQLFRQALDQRNQTILHSNTIACRSNNNQANMQQIGTDRKDHFLPMEWKVKRRQNGTRYITQRPIRNKILRNRAKEILEAQTEMTTEDDASVIKLGKYWTKEERKLHVLEREKRVKSSTIASGHWKNEMKQHRHSSSTLTNTKVSRDIHGKQTKKVVLNDKKALKKKHKEGETLEDFKTVQDMIMNGNRPSSGPNGKMIGLLSVTTV